MSQDSVSSAFDVLAKPIRKGLMELGFTSPTLPQTKAFGPILKRQNLLLIAPTGSGKTEAVLLPVFSMLLQKESRKGISIIYITPLRALNRDLLKRLSFWASRLGITIEARHGDTEMKIRRRQAVVPPDMLVTTPETLQAVLPGSRMRQHLGNVQFVIVDEVHELASSKRGVQLAVALERLRQIADRDFQTIGLSATIGNPEEVAKFVVGAHRDVRTIEVTAPKNYVYRVENPRPIQKDYDLAAELEMAPEAAARLRRMLELVDSHRSTLIFVNSRTIAEMLGHKITQLGRTDIGVHHGSLSKEERTLIEDSLKSGTLKAVICTSTLELGIDIGSVDLVIQYLSPRQVSSLIQRVGRSGHNLEMVSEGVILTAFADDTLESIASVRDAQRGLIEPVKLHENALDVLAHQIVGVIMDNGVTRLEELTNLLKQAYPFRNLSKKALLDVVDFLAYLGELKIEQGGEILGKGRRTRQYYYENLSMIPDEKRYPIVNVISDRRIGTLGDEFMALKARVGLNFIVKGHVWRIVQIEQETGTVYVVPSEDPLAAVPGWDGEMLPVPFELAQQTGRLRREIIQILERRQKTENKMAEIVQRYSISQSEFASTVAEIDEQIKQGAPLATDNEIVVEAFDKFLIIHTCFGEIVNLTLGCIFDAILSDKEVIVGWWNDGYHILIETPYKLRDQETENISKVLFNLPPIEAERSFSSYLEAKFPFSYKMKFVADRFGALPRGKTMSYERLSQLPKRFANTPIYDETLREAMTEKVDLNKTKQILRKIQKKEITVDTIIRSEKPTPAAFHILAKFADVSELMAPEHVLANNFEGMKMAIEARSAKLLCMNCGTMLIDLKIRALSEEPTCPSCGSRLLAPLYRGQSADQLRELLKKRRGGSELAEEELKELSQARRMADLVLSYGKKAVIAFEVKGVGPETASRILGRMHSKEREFYVDLLKAKIQYLRTRVFWEKKEVR